MEELKLSVFLSMFQKDKGDFQNNTLSLKAFSNRHALDIKKSPRELPENIFKLFCFHFP